MAQAWPPGWYSDTKGRMRWWDGSSWGARSAQPRATHPARTALVIMLASTLVAGGTALGVALVVRGDDGPGDISAAGTEALTALSGDVAAYTTTPQSGPDAQAACVDLAASIAAATLTADADAVHGTVAASVAGSIVDDATAQAALGTDEALDGSIIQVATGTSTDASSAAAPPQQPQPGFARHAQATPSDCLSGNFRVYYVNGLLTTSADAASYATTLGRQLDADLFLAYDLRWREIRPWRYEMCRRALVDGYPYTRFGASSFERAREDEPTVWADWLSGAVTATELDQVTPETAAISAPCRNLDPLFSTPGFTARMAWAVVKREVEAAAEAALDFDPAAAPITPTLVAAIEQDVVVGRSVVVIGHSTGSLIARNAIAQVQAWFDTKKAEPGGWDDVETLPVAGLYVSPAFSPVQTSTEGYVLEALDWLERFSGAAATDTPGLTDRTISAELTPLVVHDLWNYLARPTTSERISEVFARQRRFVEDNSPGPLAQGGVIHATLNWSAPNDVDLYVTEPGGTRVFYGALQGVSGALDLDDRQGTGPENYRVLDCASLRSGVYEIGVSYFAAVTEPAASVTATVSVVAGPYIERQTVTLDAPDHGDVVTPLFRVTYDAASKVFRVDVV